MMKLETLASHRWAVRSDGLEAGGGGGRACGHGVDRNGDHATPTVEGTGVEGEGEGEREAGDQEEEERWWGEVPVAVAGSRR